MRDMGMVDGGPDLSPGKIVPDLERQSSYTDYQIRIVCQEYQMSRIVPCLIVAQFPALINNKMTAHVSSVNSGQSMMS